MNCHVCGAGMQAIITDLPFKTTVSSIVIVRSLPVLQCENCAEYMLEDSVMARVEAILDGLDANAELEIVQYAA